MSSPLPTIILTCPQPHLKRRSRFSKGGSAISTSILHMDPYALLPVIGDLLEEQPDRLVVEIGCLTRVTSWRLTQRFHVQTVLGQNSFCHTAPRRYEALLGKPSASWDRVQMLPLLAGALGNAGLAQGLILLGHESDRLLVAMSEFEADGAQIAISGSAGRPTFGAVARADNRTALTFRSLAGKGTWVERDCLVGNTSWFEYSLAYRASGPAEERSFGGLSGSPRQDYWPRQQLSRPSGTPANLPPTGDFRSCATRCASPTGPWR